MTTPWHPDIKRDLVPGKPASASHRVISACMLVAAVALPLVVAGFFAGYGEPAPPWWVLAFLVFGFSGVIGRFALARSHRSGDREREVGYTTIAPNIDDADYVDAKSRRVVRLASEPHLSRAELRRRRALVREAAARDFLGQDS